MKKLDRGAIERWLHDVCEADSRWLSLFRIVYGIGLIAYAIVVPTHGRLVQYYTDQGLLPVRAFTELHPINAAATFFRFAHTETQALVGFGLCGLFALLFTTGTLTRITGPLAVLGVVSIHQRVPYVVNGAMAVMHLVGLWSVFLPLGRHWSVDAWLARRRGETLPPIRIRSFAMIGLRLQLFVIYFFNVVHKDGDLWRNGEAIHYVFWYSPIALQPAIFLREHLPSFVLHLMTWGALVLEGTIALCVISPFERVRARRLAAALMIAFHGSLTFLFNIGPFPQIFSAAALFLLASEDGRWLGAKLGVPGEAQRMVVRGARRVAVGVRETGFVVLGLMLGILCWRDLAGMRWAFGRVPPRLLAIAEPLDFKLFVAQRWAMFSGNPPSISQVMLPIVELADGRVVDALTREPMDLERLDGRPLDTDFYGQVEDVVLRDSRESVRWDAYCDWIARLPTLQRWPGERRVREVVVQELSIERRPTESGGRHEPRLRALYVKRYLPREEPGRFIQQ